MRRLGDMRRRVIPAAMIALAICQPAFGQAPGARRTVVPVGERMRLIAEALGVGCAYCHVERPEGGIDYRSDVKPVKQTAREMIAMTHDINTMIGVSRPSPATVSVDCVTCHRGVAIPRQLSDIVKQVVDQQGGAAAADRYRALRKQYFGRQSYDFGEEPLLRVIQGLIDVRPDDAIALLQMNIEFNPGSSRSYSALAHAHTRKFDDASAIAALEKALELDPDNNIARGQLESLNKFRRKK